MLLVVLPDRLTAACLKTLRTDKPRTNHAPLGSVNLHVVGKRNSGIRMQ
jgi:hypothetical protein